MDHPAETTRSAALSAFVSGVLFVLLASPPSLDAQTISGTLRDSDSRQPIPLGLVLMYTEAGDSVTSTISDGSGRFRISSPDPGSFILQAAALGYRETPVGVFDLGDGGSMTVEYLLAPAPLPVDALMVEIDRPVVEHHLVQNGFVRRLQRGLGKFITPHDIENSTARSTESLMEGIQGVRVGTVRTRAGGLGIPSPHLGETVQIAGPHGGWCEPTVYVDGIRTHYDPETGFTLSHVAHLGAVEAVEVYRRPTEIPVEFGVGSGSTNLRTGNRTGGCGVLVVWTKRGLAAGQRPEWFRSAETALAEESTLPDVASSDSPLVTGDEIRVQMDRELAAARGLRPILKGRFTTVDSDALVVRDAVTEQPYSLPLPAVEAVHVSRAKDPVDALRRGMIAGSLSGLGTAGFLVLLCEFTCRGDAGPSVGLPSLGVGLFVGTLVWSKGPGSQWVRAPLPGPRPGTVRGPRRYRVSR